jgi:hypothetical protein
LLVREPELRTGIAVSGRCKRRHEDASEVSRLTSMTIATIRRHLATLKRCWLGRDVVGADLRNQDRQDLDWKTNSAKRATISTSTSIPYSITREAKYFLHSSLLPGIVTTAIAATCGMPRRPAWW